VFHSCWCLETPGGYMQLDCHSGVLGLLSVQLNVDCDYQSLRNSGLFVRESFL
jgi:hypothetical protein